MPIDLEVLKQVLTGYYLRGLASFDEATRIEGYDRPAVGETMIGMKRINNLHQCLEGVLKDGIPGDMIETGVWRGGATIFMRAVLKASGDHGKTVWVADSFDGLPPPAWPQDDGDIHHLQHDLKVGLEEVQANFRKYGLLDSQVKFLKGWFCDTLPAISAEQKFCLIRLDGDMYQSTMEAMDNLYPKLSTGGYVIIDDYGAIGQCKMAVDDYRNKNNISEPIIPIDRTGIYWKKTR